MSLGTDGFGGIKISRKLCKEPKYRRSACAVRDLVSQKGVGSILNVKKSSVLCRNSAEGVSHQRQGELLGV